MMIYWRAINDTSRFFLRQSLIGAVIKTFHVSACFELLFKCLRWFRYFVNVQMFFSLNLDISIHFTNIIFFTCTHSFVYCASYCSYSLKLVSAIFYQIVILNQMIALQKLGKMFFISYKKLFSFLRYSNFCIFVFLSFSFCQPLHWRLFEDKSCSLWRHQLPNK